MSDSQPDLASEDWDVIVVGSGIGGATVARSVALDGLKVLILEKGRRISANVDQNEHTSAQNRLDRGWWPAPITQRRSDGTCVQFFAAIGCAVGGSSIHYAAALERLAATDFQEHAGSMGRVPQWPVSYDEFAPFYGAAEKLYRVQTASDAAALGRLSDWDRAIMENMRQKGLKPEILHVAIDYDKECQECIGRICPRGCKADAQSACLVEALRQPNCRILENCEVQSLDADIRKVRAVRAVCDGREVEFRARVVVLSAGAFHSPQILLRSRNAAWPSGLANSSDQVGRNLMFHTADIFAIWAPRRMDRRARQKKAVSVRDFYICDGKRLGYVQSMGLEIGRGAIAMYLKDFGRRHGIRSELLLSLLAKIPSYAGAALLGNAGVFAAMTEDDANPNNRVVLDPAQPNGAHFTYTITADLRQRAEALRNAFADAIRPWHLMRLSPTLSMNYGHPCGTCRFGEDQESSVLDRNCKAHDLENLFVVDASFMPRSGAVNPSLTIAANALRVAGPIALSAAS